MKFPILAVSIFTTVVAIVQAAPLHDAALASLGATAKGSGAKFNRDWPAARVLSESKGGTIFDPFEGATIDIRLIMPVEIHAVEITGLDYQGTRQVSGVDLFIDNTKITHAELPDAPGTPTRIDIPPTTGQMIRLVATGGHPIRTDKNGKPGPNWGGFAKIGVLTPENLTEKLRPVDNYAVATSPTFIAPTIQSREKPNVEVNGQPRTADGHPRTLWDKEDVRHFRSLIGTNPEFTKKYEALKRSMDDLLTQPATVPEPVKGADGEWMHLTQKAVADSHTKLSLQISNLATIYALSGEEKYADRAKKLLLAYADAFDKYAPGNRPGFKHDQGRVFDQRLSDATWLIPIVRGYDLIHDSPGLTPEERPHIENDLLKASAKFIIANSAMLRSPTNWSAICTAAVLITGYATDDQNLIDLATYGPGGTKENPEGGVMLHFSDRCISPDGLWSEGAIGYQFMAMQALVTDAEILWRNGVDMYRYRDGAFKKLFDSPIAYSFPDLKTPSVHDSGSIDIVGRESYLYEFAYQRYGDPRHLLILNHPNTATRLDTRFQQFPLSVLYERDRKAAPPPIEWLSENFSDVGFGILRNTTPDGTVSLLLDYGPDRSHGHPDKMNIDLWTSRTGRLIPDPGVVWYENPLYRNWYRTSLAHNTLVVDEQDQIESDGNLLVYGFADGMGIQRAQALKTAPGVTMDRAVLLTPEYLADLFGAFARLPRKMELAWHVTGEFSTTAPMQPFTFPEPRQPGYTELVNVQSMKSDKPWTATFSAKGVPVRLHAAAAGETEIITGDGWFGGERPKTVLFRRQEARTIFGSVVDISGKAEPFVRDVALEGSLEKGCALMTVSTSRGKDLAFASYRPGTYCVGGLETDALQSFVRRESNNPTGLFIGGGKFLRVDGIGLSLDSPGLAALEQVGTGAWVLSNLSLQKAEITLDFPALADHEIHRLDAQGRRVGAVPKGKTFPLAPGEHIEFAATGQPSVFDFRSAMLRKRQEEQAATLAAGHNAAVERSKTRENEAAAAPAPATTTIVIQAEDFSAQGGGEVKVNEHKTGQIGKSLSAWNDEGHWLEWNVEVPADGYYNISLCYCTEPNNSTREIQVNGSVQEPFAPFVLPATGGYSNGNDDWQFFTAMDPITEKALLLKFKKGPNTIRLTNTNGLAANIDYLVVSSPDAHPTRETVTRIGK